MNTKIKNLLQGSITKNIFALIATIMVFVSFGSYLVKPQTASADINDPCQDNSLSPTYTYTQNDNKYHFVVTMGYNGGTVGGPIVDQTTEWNYAWSINTPPTSVVISKNSPTVDGPLNGIAPGAYLGTVVATRKDTTLYPKSCTANFNISIGSGASAGYMAQIDSATAVSGPDSNNNYTYSLIAELDNAANNNAVVSGGSASNNTDGGYNWSWTEAKENSDGSFAGASPVLLNGVAQAGYNVQATFAVGTYKLTATASPKATTSGSAIPSPSVTINVGNSSSASLTLTEDQTSGFSYKLNAPATCTSTAFFSAPDCSSSYTYTWSLTVDGTAVPISGAGNSVTATLQTGTDVIKVTAQNNSDHSTVTASDSLVVDSNGNVTSRNSNSTASAVTDACSSVSSSGITCIVGRVIGTVLGYITEFISYLTSNLLLPITIAILGISVHTSQFSAVIIQEWVFIRNFCNIFFIATLIIVGMGTLLQMSSYNLKQVLPRFIIAALLVNFSLAISQAILGVADAFQAQFLGATSGQSTTILDNLAYRLMVAPLTNLSHSSAAALAGVTSAVITEFIYFLIAIVAVFVFVALTAYLLIRVVALWLLLMSSPIAYAASVVPVKFIQAWASKWWNNFFKYAFFTPIIALLLHICALLANAQSSFTAAGVSEAAQAASGITGTQLLVTDVLTAMLVAACMGAALSVAKSMSIAGADKVMAGFDSVQGKVFGAPKAAAGWAGGYALDRANRFRRNLGEKASTDSQGNPRGGRFNPGRLFNLALNPDAALKTMSTNFDEKNKTAQELANARADRFSGLNQTGVDKKNDISLRQKKRDEKTSQFMNFDRETLLDMQGQATDNETRMQILAARAKLGYLKRDAQEKYGQDMTDEQFRDYSLSAIKDVPARQQKAYIEQTFDKLGEEKKDLSLIGWSDFQSGGATKQADAQMEKLKSWGPDDMSKVKTGPMKTNDALQKQFVKQVSQFDVADQIKADNIKNLSDDNLATLIPKMSPSAIGNLDKIRDKQTGDCAIGKVTQDKIIEAGIKNDKVFDSMPQLLKEAFKGTQRVELIKNLDGEAAMKLSNKYISESHEATVEIANKINLNPNLVDKASNDVLTTIMQSAPTSITNTEAQIRIATKLGKNTAKTQTPPTVTSPTPSARPAAPITPPASPIIDPTTGRPFDKNNMTDPKEPRSRQTF